VDDEENESFRSVPDMYRKFVLVYIAIISVAVAVSLYANYLNPANPWHRLDVWKAAKEPATIKFGDDFYIFGWVGIGYPEQPFIGVANPLYNGGISSLYYAGEGETYGFYHIEMKISEVHSDYAVLLVKPLD